jgi:hypothetical protein
MQGGTGIPQSVKRLNEDMPGKSLNDTISLKEVAPWQFPAKQSTNRETTPV